MKTMIILAMLLAMSLSGCAREAVNQPLPEGANTVTDATGKTIVDEAPANETVKTGSGKQVAVNKALLHGRVHDDFNFSLSGAFISVVGTAHFTQTNETGHYLLENVTVGTFDIRFEMDQFRAREERVTLSAGQDLRLDAELLPLQPRSGGFNPHVHDNWGAQATRVLMDASFAINQELDATGAIKGRLPGIVGGVQCGIRTCNYPFMLPEQDDGAPASIWPGTKELRVSLGWSGTTMEVGSMRLDYADPTMSSLERLQSEPVASGGTIVIVVTPEMQDHGHARWSGWRFEAVTINEPTAPGVVYGQIHVKVEIVKGDVVLDPPHEDKWQGRTEYGWMFRFVPNMSPGPTTSESTSLNHVFSIPRCSDEQLAQGCLQVIPPGTERLDILFKWLPNAQGVKAPFEYALAYKAADDPPDLPGDQYHKPTLVDEDLAADWRRYEIVVGSEQTDAFYVQRSDWLFKWVQDTGLPYNVGQNQFSFDLEITAFKAA